MKTFSNLKKLTAIALAISAFGASAQEELTKGFTNPVAQVSDALESATGIKLFGYAQGGYAKANNGLAAAGHSNYPVVGAPDGGFQFNEVTFALERPIQTNILPRITPLPGPMPWEFSWGFRAEYMYGRNGLPAGMQGFGVDTGPKASPAVAGGSGRENYVAMPQVFAQFFFPVGMGLALTVGRFGSGIGRDIPPAWIPGPNVFYSHTYALVSQPDQVTGALISANLMRNDMGFLAGELGFVKGRQNWVDNNNSKSAIGALRWRSTDMSTWIDYSFMRGNEQNDMTVVSAPQMPIARIISPRGQLRDHHSFTVGFSPADKWQLNAEVLFGKQSGDSQPGTIDALTFNPAAGNFFKGATYSGINGQAVYTANSKLRYAVRVEKFRDMNGFALFPVTAVPSEFNAITAGLTYELAKNVRVRPEIRHDWQSNNNGINAFGRGKSSKQTTISADLLIYF